MNAACAPGMSPLRTRSAPVRIPDHLGLADLGAELCQCRFGFREVAVLHRRFDQGLAGAAFGRRHGKRALERFGGLLGVALLHLREAQMGQDHRVLGCQGRGLGERGQGGRAIVQRDIGATQRVEGGGVFRAGGDGFSRTGARGRAALRRARPLRGHAGLRDRWGPACYSGGRIRRPLRPDPRREATRAW